MPAEKRLTDRQIKNSPPGKLYDGGGLICVKGANSAKWVYRYTLYSARRDEGAKKTYELTKFERDPSLRREALKFYEFKCYCCDKRPKIQSMIEIHHLNPIAQGERETKVEDVLPLCRNCHSAAHSEEPPIPIERLKVMDLWKVD